MTGADAIAIIALLIILVAVGVYLLHWLYRHSSKDEAFVRTGLGGEKVVMGGGAFVIPIVHDVIRVNMNTVPLDIKRSGEASLITRNKMRVVPGLTSKAMSVASGYAPRAIVAPIVGSFYKKLGGG